MMYSRAILLCIGALSLNDVVSGMDFKDLDLANLDLDSFSTEKHFELWANTYNVTFEEHELEYRKAIWRVSLNLVKTRNERKDSTYKLAMNEFAAHTHAEFAAEMLMSPQDGCSATEDGWSASLGAEQLPAKIDWREKGIVSPVKSQGKCGSCWTFSSTGAIEAHTALYKDVKILLSEQQLVDCAGPYECHGCGGCLPSHAFEYIHFAGGLMTESEYPYHAKNEKCKFNKTAPELVRVKTSVNITAYDEDSLTAAVATKGPVSIAYHVGEDFRLYHSGVYSNPSCPNSADKVNHAVLAVGYGVEEDQDGMKYFLIKNSWGTKWGIDGYFKIERGVNMCGLSVCSSYPIIDDVVKA